jgi:2-polyprenyl-3-methyl-5-hydroxy-6-metoxy-1,4-benzoquinol methylase
MERQQHWEKIYTSKAATNVSWFRPHLETSLALIERAAHGNRDAAIIDVGGGASTLVDDLIQRGYTNITVVDIAEAALDAARLRLGQAGAIVQWIRADVTEALPSAQRYDIWHDRAVFHFLTDAEARRAYVRNVGRSVKEKGHVAVSTFGPEGPTKCSGLDVVRYDADSLHDEFGPRFRLLESTEEIHQTPFGTAQQFLYCYCIVESV